MSVCAAGDLACAPWASCLDDYFPCSERVVGNLFLMVVYGFILAKGSKLLADGTELLMEILNPGFIGGFVLPVLGALPDTAIIFVSGLSGDRELVKEEITVGMGTLAGSTIMLLTIAWSASVYVGRCNLGKDGKAIDKTLTDSHKRSITETGVTCDDDLKINSRIMCATALAYFIIQGAAFKHISSGTSEEQSQKEEAPAAIATLIITALAFLAYSVYMITNTQMQSRRLAAAKKKFMLDKLADMFHERIIEKQGSIIKDDDDAADVGNKSESLGASLLDNAADTGEIEMGKSINTTGANPRHKITHDPSMRLSKIDDEVLQVVGNWKKQINMEEFEKKHKFRGEEADEHEEEGEGEAKLPVKTILLRSVLMMTFGTAVIILFSSPMVQVISKFSSQIGIQAFYTSFIVTPFVSNASEVIAAIIFASRKRKKNISLTFGAIYGAVTMNNTLCLTVFLIMIYARKLAWTFTAEVVSIIFVIGLMGVVTSFKTTFKSWYAILVLSFYPLSLGLVVILKSQGLQ